MVDSAWRTIWKLTKPRRFFWQDYGLGFSCSSLALGCDCLGHIKYFPAVLNTNQGGMSPPWHSTPAFNSYPSAL